jgi:hypothetical protein
MRTRLRQHRTYVIVALLGLAALAGGLFAVLTGGGHAQAISATSVSTTITVDPAVNETFAPPASASPAPAMTATQAFLKWMQDTGQAQTTIPSNISAQLGLLTLPTGPDCGSECQGLIIQNGMAYQALNQLAYGYSWSVCPASSTLPDVNCLRWIFLDANTGHMIDGVLNLPAARPPTS